MIFQLIISAVVIAIPVGLAWHWWCPFDWTGRRKSLKLRKRRNDWDDNSL